MKKMLIMALLALTLVISSAAVIGADGFSDYDPIHIGTECSEVLSVSQ